MRYVYQAYVDYGRRGMREETHIGESIEALEARIREQGYRLVDANVRWKDTIDLWQSRSFPAREMAQVYRSLSRRLAQGARPQDALTQAGSFVTHPVLRIALNSAAAAVLSGQRMDEALLNAGFDDEDVSLIRSMSDAGNLPEAFSGLSLKHEQRAQLGGKLRGILIQPVIYSILGLLMIWASFVFLIPRFDTFFSKAGMHPPPGIGQIYAVDGVIQQNVWAFSVGYWFLVGLMAVVLVSKPVRQLYRKLPILRDLLARSDAAQTLTAFALLYESAIRRSEAARRVASSSTWPALSDAFGRLANALESGRNPADAARGAEFPDFLASTMVGAMGANDPSATIEDLRVFSKMLTEDVEMLSKRLEVAMNLVFMALAAVMVLGVFAVTIFPELATVLSNA
ncbi:type II secretion system F family protein [Acidihalobacter ferrooxydans]|uniref:Type II secretion system protein GspF domain-containing protein n=1 Tax=Acidihalobacter ferrooxydans TaxID=1765967 RepID=A0A1P8UFM7_9GAMM|nr:type II secretion system F family protein [Acidihalobacter ferrooxydans]APZ42554.1 hypothetical protein BW247_05140 [Acidihalobacter ferrooxydans]